MKGSRTKEQYQILKKEAEEVKRKRLLLLFVSTCLILALAVSPFMAACAAPAVEPGAAEIAALQKEVAALEKEIAAAEKEIAKLKAPAPPAVPAKVFEWDMYTCAGQYSHWEEENMAVLAKELEEFTNGQLKISIFWAGEHPYSVVKTLEAISKGECDMAEVPSYYQSGIEPALAGINLPFLIPSWEIFVKVHEQMLETYTKDILAEKWNCKELISGLWGPENFFLADGFITSFDSVKGRKLRSWCPETANLISLLNAEPITVAYAELYTALQTGLVDGFCTNTLSAMRAGFFEVCPYITIFNFAYGPCMMSVNLDSWNELPPELRDAVTDFLELKRDWFLTGILKDDGMTLLTAAITEYNLHIMAPPTKFREEMRASAYEAVHKPWMERVGPTGKESYNEMAKILKAEGYPMPGYVIK